MKYKIGIFEDTGIKAALAVIASGLTLIGAITMGNDFLENNSVSEAVDPTIKVEKELTKEPIPKEFEKGEHTIAVQINVPIDKIGQIPYYEGYKFVGVSYDSNIRYAIYTNEEKVLCSPTGTDMSGKYVYNNFGTLEEQKQEKDFYDVGQHIITVPINRPNDNMQYEYHEGYEVVDMVAMNTKWKYLGGFVVYANTVPVKGTTDQNGQSLRFLKPVETEKDNTPSKWF